MVWEVLKKAVWKGDVILSMIMEIGSAFEAWRALVEMSAETNDAASDREKKGLEDLQLGSSENVGEYLVRVNVVISKI